MREFKQLKIVRLPKIKIGNPLLLLKTNLLHELKCRSLQIQLL
jgi:hypothetical protein